MTYLLIIITGDILGNYNPRHHITFIIMILDLLVDMLDASGTVLDSENKPDDHDNLWYTLKLALRKYPIVPDYVFRY